LKDKQSVNERSAHWRKIVVFHKRHHRFTADEQGMHPAAQLYEIPAEGISVKKTSQYVCSADMAGTPS
jgi:hypothetical protein